MPTKTITAELIMVIRLYPKSEGKAVDELLEGGQRLRMFLCPHFRRQVHTRMETVNVGNTDVCRAGCILW